MARSLSDKLRTAMNLTYPRQVQTTRTVVDSRGGKRQVKSISIRTALLYSQKELAEAFGVSTRALRRFKNENHQLSPATLANIRKPLEAFDRSLIRDLKKGAAFTTETKTTRGVRRKKPVRIYADAFKLPTLGVLQYPVIYPAKEKQSFTIRVNVALWSTGQKIEYLLSSHESKRFSSWHIRVDLREYLIKKLIAEYGSLEDVPPEAMAEVLTPHMVIAGPFSLGRGRGDASTVRDRIKYYDDAGRKIVDIYIVEKLDKSPS